MPKACLADRAYQALVRKIALRELAPGQSVVELEVARELSMSRTPVRAAIQALVRDGLLERGRNGRCSVINPQPEDLLEMLEIREALEGMAAVMAARGDKKHVRALRDIADALEVAAREENAAMYWQKDFEFHRQLLRGCGNRRISEFTSAETLLLVTFVCKAVNPFDRPVWTSAVTHAAIVEAICARDPFAAEAAVRLHLRISKQDVERIINQERAAETPIVV